MNLLERNNAEATRKFYMKKASINSKVFSQQSLVFRGH
jgi:hypothetical protein